mmetsp:Transcript_20242/g.52898  ORF Transcript_20242/g.52898 Transcript_20242/m.52898 type:complete len:205 (-) Transcript_20242:89-703(-)
MPWSPVWCSALCFALPNSAAGPVPLSQAQPAWRYSHAQRQAALVSLQPGPGAGGTRLRCRLLLQAGPAPLSIFHLHSRPRVLCYLQPASDSLVLARGRRGLGRRRPSLLPVLPRAGTATGIGPARRRARCRIIRCSLPPFQLRPPFPGVWIARTCTEEDQRRTRKSRREWRYRSRLHSRRGRLCSTRRRPSSRRSSRQQSPYST